MLHNGEQQGMLADLAQPKYCVSSAKFCPLSQFQNCLKCLLYVVKCIPCGQTSLLFPHSVPTLWKGCWGSCLGCHCHCFCSCCWRRAMDCQDLCSSGPWTAGLETSSVAGNSRHTWAVNCNRQTQDMFDVTIMYIKFACNVSKCIPKYIWLIWQGALVDRQGCKGMFLIDGGIQQ